MDNASIYILLAAAGGLFAGIFIAFLIWKNSRRRGLQYQNAIEEEARVCAGLKVQLADAEERLQGELENCQSEITHLKEENMRLIANVAKLETRNLELDQLLKEGQPVIHTLKMKLIEANNTIVRYKAQLGLKA